MKNRPQKVRSLAQRTYIVKSQGQDAWIQVWVSQPRRNKGVGAKCFVHVSDSLGTSRGTWIIGIDHLQATMRALHFALLEIRAIHKLDGVVLLDGDEAVDLDLAEC